jgi:hypothetical protein
MLGVDFEIIWSDQDVVKYEVRCSNGFFSGATMLYSGHGGLTRAADALIGFPTNTADSRIVQLGTFDPTKAGGGINLEFSCVDSVGHAMALVKLRSAGCKSMGEAESVSLYIPIEANGIDSFVEQVRAIGNVQGGRAHLRMAEHRVTQPSPATSPHPSRDTSK